MTVTRTGDLDARSLFFADADPPPLVYAPALALDDVAARLSAVALVVAAPSAGAAGGLDLPWLLADLAARGVGRLMVEGGSSILAQFLSAGAADEFLLAVAPVFVADRSAPRLLEGAPAAGRMVLAGVSQAGDMAVLRYLPAR